ncbi:hypothetical protein [Verrucomicrobium spinosum]|uniref:hypothetical protein n=1 Tax=Verrucomicrobium spinosum TaxID=2736 RepID=UPI00017463AC|nr:hypothetical protein [Verrucomicrobium spinosum]
MQTIAQLKDRAVELQRKAPAAAETKDAQRAYQAALNEVAMEKRAEECRERQAREKRERAELRARILAPVVVPAGKKLVTLTAKQAEWAGMAPSVAGGWVAVGLMMMGSGYVALVPERWTDGEPIDVGTVQRVWSERCYWPEELADAVGKIEGMGVGK